MLDTLRQHSRSLVITILFGIIIVVFVVSFGPGSSGFSQGEAGPTWAAYVNGELVTASEFLAAYSDRFARQRAARGGQYDGEAARADKLRESTLKELTDRLLLKQEAERAGLWVSDEELSREIRKITAFHTDGKFDFDLYSRYVTNVLGLSPSTFEARMRRDLLAQKVYLGVVGQVTVSDDEVKAEFLRQNEGAAIEYVRLSPHQFRDDAKATDADVDAYIKEHRKEMEEQYEKTKFLYFQPRQLKVRRILAKAPEEGGKPAEGAAAKKKIEDARARIAGGEDFAKVAGEVSEEAKEKAAGGDLGFIALGRSAYGRAIEEAAFKLKAGEMSEPVRDRFGWSLLKVEEEKEPVQKKLEEVEREIAAELLKDVKAKELAREKAQWTLDQMKAGKKLADLWPAPPEPKPGEAYDPAAARRPRALDTRSFHPAGGLIPGLGQASEVSRAVFALAQGGIAAAPVEDQEAFWVFRVKERTRADLSKLDDTQKKQLRERVEGMKRGALANEWLEKLRKRSDVRDNPVIISYEADLGQAVR
jgi:peptidyl-prolyl cis-trans isomerase D